MSSAYIISHIQVTNPTQYEHYKRLSSLAMQAHGAEVCVRGGAVQVLEGDWKPERLVVLKFPSITQASRRARPIEGSVGTVTGTGRYLRSAGSR